MQSSLSLDPYYIESKELCRDSGRSCNEHLSLGELLLNIRMSSWPPYHRRGLVNEVNKDGDSIMISCGIRSIAQGNEEMPIRVAESLWICLIGWTGDTMAEIFDMLLRSSWNASREAYRVDVAHWNEPSLIALSRQKVTACVEGTSEDAVERGGYIISDNSCDVLPEIILICTGSELCLCEASARVMKEEERRMMVISLVCWRLFEDILMILSMLKW
ncbi:unnamed protein product [Fraxinus pennsylvanica]|uniref:Transketolase-like C-terminal domain-containing protein n=1 Tax=Fraxinus pennsylvanica TaxID=56036 RepID=A0AAD2A8S8_9LAMI|nr:unnamed protein product [Fraxinus pennsylvanica]